MFGAIVFHILKVGKEQLQAASNLSKMQNFLTVNVPECCSSRLPSIPSEQARTTRMFISYENLGWSSAQQVGVTVPELRVGSEWH